MSDSITHTFNVLPQVGGNTVVLDINRSVAHSGNPNIYEVKIFNNDITALLALSAINVYNETTITITFSEYTFALGNNIRVFKDGNLLDVINPITNLSSNNYTISAEALPPAEAGESGAVNTNVVVNLDVLIDANGKIEVFGQPQLTTPTNIIVANVELPVVGLYDSAKLSGTVNENSMFEFWEDNLNRGNRAATLSGKDSSTASNGRNYKKLTKRLVRDLQAVLEGSFNVAGATPFNNSKYTGVIDYATTYGTVVNFGELALRTYAHYLLGHIDSSAIITNDLAFVRAMLSRNESDVYKEATAMDGYDEWVPRSSSDGITFSNIVGDKLDAKLAQLLVQAIVTKDNTAVLAIVEQVLGQDASRAMDQDNNPALPDVRQALKFIAGDTIYMNIRLIAPDVIVGGGQKVSDLTVEGKYPALDLQDDKNNYTLKITLA